MIMSANKICMMMKCILYMCLIRERDQLETYLSLDFVSRILQYFVPPDLDYLLRFRLCVLLCLISNQ